VEGENLILEWRSAEGRFERFPDIVRELVSLNVDVIVTVTTPMTKAAKDVTQTVPIVMLSGNPVEEGLVQSLARPGGNITGITHLTGGENTIKHAQLLKEILPGMSRVARLQSKAEALGEHAQIEEAINRKLGVKVLTAWNMPSDYSEAFGLITKERPDAVLVAANAANYANRKLIIEFAAKNRLPAIYSDRDYVVDGGLLAYGADLKDIFQRLAGYVSRILKGEKPADMPVEQPTKFLLTINLKTAKTLDLGVPATLLARADEVIE
jgi:putative ABC transport system substrate-binding protein